MVLVRSYWLYSFTFRVLASDLEALLGGIRVRVRGRIRSGKSNIVLVLALVHVLENLMTPESAGGKPETIKSSEQIIGSYHEITTH